MVKYADIDPKRVGLACGILSGIWLLLLALLGRTEITDIIGSIFPGYAATGAGAVYGLVYGIIVLGATGYAYAYLYNYLKGKLKR